MQVASTLDQAATPACAAAGASYVDPSLTQAGQPEGSLESFLKEGLICPGNGDDRFN